MSTIKKLKAEVDRLTTELANAKDDLFRAIVAEGGFAEGEVVEARRRYGRDIDGRPAVIRRITLGWFGDRCHYVISFAKKDGDWSKVETSECEVRKAQ